MNFLAPIAFWFAATLPIVVVFYLLKRKRVVKLVSSTMLWQKFLAETQANAPFQRLRHNWLLLFQLLLLVLQFVESAVDAVMLQELVMRAHFADLALVQDDDLVNLLNSRQSMRNDNGSAT